MTDIFDTLKSVLVAGCAVPVYYELLPSNGVDNPSYVRFQRISTHEFINHSGRSNLHRDRFQVTCVGRTHNDLMTLISDMETALYCNNINFKLCYPLEGSREVNDGACTYSKDFYLFYNTP